MYKNLTKTQLIEKIYKYEAEHEFLQNVIDSMSDTVMVVRSDESVGLMDETIRHKLQTAKIADKKNPKCYEIYHNRETPCDGVDYPCPLQDVLKTKEKTTVLHKEIHEDGTTSYLELVGTPIFDKEKNCIGIVESTRDVTLHLALLEEVQEKSRQLTFQANHDCLTKLPNRSLFMDRLKEGMKSAKREKSQLALMFIDLDDFKDVNDMYGHEAGDKVLQEVAQKFQTLIRDTDTIARLGGDEFTIILKTVNKIEDAKRVAKKVVETLNSFSLEFNGNTISLSCSIGVSIYNGAQDEYNPDILLNHADQAMYKAKKRGKNSVQYHI